MISLACDRGWNRRPTWRPTRRKADDNWTHGLMRQLGLANVRLALLADVDFLEPLV